MAVSWLKPLLSVPVAPYRLNYSSRVIASFATKPQSRISAAKMATSGPDPTVTGSTKVIDSHLHVWASPQEVKLNRNSHNHFFNV